MILRRSGAGLGTSLLGCLLASCCSRPQRSPQLCPAPLLQLTLYQRGAEPAAASDGEEGEEAGAGQEKLGRISFVDLAGSERAQRTGNVGVRLK